MFHCTVQMAFTFRFKRDLHESFAFELYCEIVGTSGVEVLDRCSEMMMSGLACSKTKKIAWSVLIADYLHTVEFQ